MRRSYCACLPLALRSFYRGQKLTEFRTWLAIHAWVAGSLAIWWLLPSADAEVNQAAIAAAMGVWGYITGVDIQIAKCREIDPVNADSYDLAYGSYHRDIASPLLRINTLLSTEVARAGAPKDFIANRQQPIQDPLTREVRREVETNPGLWLAACRELPAAASKLVDEFQPQRERYPGWMRQIDEWR
jgi:hypothetical protein